MRMVMVATSFTPVAPGRWNSLAVPWSEPPPHSTTPALYPQVKPWSPDAVRKIVPAGRVSRTRMFVTSWGPRLSTVMV